MRLLMLPRYDALGASSRLRMLQYVPLLQAHNIEVDVAPLLADGYVTGLYAGHVSKSKVVRAYLHRLRHLLHSRHHDVLWVEKELWPWLPGWLERLPIPVRPALVLDYDDAVFHRYDRHSSSLVRTLLGNKIDAAMRRADLVTAGNDYLAERARMAGCGKVEWLPTVIDLERYPASQARSPDGPVVVGWIGSPSTASYLHSTSNALAPLQASGLIRCVAVGARPDQVQGTPFEAREWHEHTEVAQLREFDIGIMPLPDEPWERGKCGYKLIQYMACTLPVVASPVGVNTRIVQHGSNGLLADSPAQWAEAITRLVDNVGLRRQMGQAGRRQVENTYSLQVQADRLIAMLRGAARGEMGACAG